jgi:hypothetical protein
LELIHEGNVDNVDGLIGILGCGVVFFTLKYLGLPLGASYNAKHIWDGVIEKIEHRLGSLKMMYLSKGSRIIPYQAHPIQLIYIFYAPLSLLSMCCKPY